MQSLKALITLLSAFTYIELIFFLVIVFFLYIIYLKMTDDDYYSELQNIKTKYQARMWEYLSGELRIIEAMSLNRAETIFGIEIGKEVPEDIGRQFAMYGLVLERSVHYILFESVKTAIRINGFVDMTPDDLESYVSDKAHALLRESRKSINAKVRFYPMLRGTDEHRFSLDDATKVYYKIVKKYIKLHGEEEKALRELKRQYSIWTKINIVGSIINKLKKSK
jgi:hypothetical protein